MFGDNQFYPTPEPVIAKMVSYVTRTVDVFEMPKTVLNGNRILEPSAGAGAICDYLIAHFGNGRYHQRLEIECCEIDPDLRATLQGKGYRVINSDFLAHQEPITHELVLMNPSFRDGVAHLLHAWSLLHNGEIVCLLNSHRLQHNTKKVDLLNNIIAEHGKTEELGAAFAEAERPTDVPVVLVYLKKENPSPFDFETMGLAADYLFAEADDQVDMSGALVSADAVDALVARHQAASNAAIEAAKAKRKLAYYMQGIERPDEAEQVEKGLREQLQKIKKDFWSVVFRATRVGQMMTSEYRKGFDQFLDANKNLAFSRANIVCILDEIMFKRDEIIEQCILNVFDKFTRYYKENRVHVEGWKNNKSWKVANKVILPYMVEGKFSGGLQLRYDAAYTCRDIDIAFCHLSGKPINGIVTIEQAVEACREQHAFSEFFELRWYWKGTLHLKPRDKALWAEFNRQAAQGKGWLGAGD